MRVLFVSQYFPPEIGAPSARVFELAREWVRGGHEVTVLTAFAHHPTGVKARADRGRITRRERVEGIDVVRAYVWATPNERVAKRMVSYLSFAASALLVGILRVPRPDVVVATTPQLLCGAAGYVVARLLRRPFVLEVRDLWPESILAVGAMRENAIVRLLKRVAAHLYAHSDLLVTVGEGYRREINRLYGLPLAAMEVIPNGIDPGFFVSAPCDEDLRREMGWSDRFVVLYLGTLGMAHGLDTMIDAAELLRNDPRILFALVGEGAEKARLRRLAEERGLTNVRFVDQQPKARVPRFYAACDVGLVCLRDRPLFREVLPSKIFELMGSERPILIAVDGEARQVVEAAQAGWFVPPEDPAALAAAVERLVGDPAARAAAGRSGRRRVVERFSRPALARRYLEVLQGVIDRR